MLTTYESFAQTYGYFEIRADMPENQGAWPAFWLLPEDGSWPPELDVVEMRGQDPNNLIMTCALEPDREPYGGHPRRLLSRTPMASTHTASCGRKDELVWYFDNVEVARAATPADMHKPMYMLVDLARRRHGGNAG